jgi:lipopolysaccharide export system permease protein
MFTLAWIQRHNEMTALMASGVPPIRVIMPIVAAVAVVSIVSVVNREVLIPRFRSELSRRPQDPLGDKAQIVESCYDSRTDIVMSGKNSYADQKRIEEPSFLIRSPALRKYGGQWTADNAYYESPKGDRPGGYRFVGVREPKNLDSRPSLALNDRAVLITPRDADWLKSNECFVRSDIDFDFLMPEGDKFFRQLSSTPQLIAALRNPSLDYGANVRVAIHSRIVKPLLDLTLLFLGLPLVVARESRNVFIAMVTVAFWLTVLALQQCGEAVLISASLSAWAPLMIFVPLAVWMSEMLWK